MPDDTAQPSGPGEDPNQQPPREPPHDGPGGEGPPDEPPHEPPGDGQDASNDNDPPGKGSGEAPGTPAGGMVVYRPADRQLRQQITGLARTRIEAVKNDLGLLFANFPVRILNKRIVKKGLKLMKGDSIPLGLLPRLIDAADSKLFLALSALNRNPRLEPDQLAIDNITAAYQTLVFAQGELQRIREIYGAAAHEPGMGGKSWHEAEEQRQPEITVRSRDSFRPFRLDIVETQTLDNACNFLSDYIIATASLLAVPLVGSWMEQEGPDSPKFKMRNEDLSGQLAAVAPPATWTEKMKTAMPIRVQLGEFGRFYRGG